MSKLLSFLGGAAKGFIEEVDKSEKYGRETALAQMKQLAENYEKTREENSKLTNELKGVEQWTKTVYGNDATPEQIAFLQGNPVAFQALKKLDNPTKFRLNDIISIVSGNESKAVGAQRVAELPALTEKVSTALQSKGFLAREFEAAETRAASTAERQFERAYGTSAETMRAALPVQRPSVEGTFDMAKILEKTPSSMDEIIKTGEVARFQAGQKFGKNSQEYEDADATVKAAQSEIVKADTKLEERRDRLEIQRNDSKDDPIVVAALTKEINGINADIKARREATSTKSERAGTGEGTGAITYAKAKTRMEDYMNTDMVTNKGLGWRKYQEPKIVKDPATGENITIPGKKANLTPEQEKEYIEGMAAARMQGLRELGLVTAQGRPVNGEVGQLVTAYGLNRSTQTAAPVQNQQAQPVAPAVVATPAAVQPKPAQPSVDIRRERALAEAAIKAQPQNAEAIKANFKVRTKTDY
jgi:hypothetical protein